MKTITKIVEEYFKPLPNPLTDTYLSEPLKVLDKESIIDKQKMDCNCNDCVFMKRDFERLELSKAFHLRLQQEAFTRKKVAAIEDANKKIEQAHKMIKMGIEVSRYKDTISKKHNFLNEIETWKFGFNGYVVSIMAYGDCEKFKKPVSFIANTCQLETQDCFIHRKEPN